MVKSALLLFSASCIVLGTIAEIFHRASSRSFEWLIAWRYLRVQHKKSWGTFVKGSILLGVAASIAIVAHFWDARFEMLFLKRPLWQWIVRGVVYFTVFIAVGNLFAKKMRYAWSWAFCLVVLGFLIDSLVCYRLSPEPPIDSIVLSLNIAATRRLLQFIALGMFVLAHWVMFFGWLLAYFSLFTTISIFTVFLGLEALVSVLSMMGGFEYDLRQKILGTTAHVEITKPRKVFTDYRQVLKKVSRIDGVVAAAPFIESEVMITSQNNLSGILLRGIDPSQTLKVTDLKRFLANEGGSGSLENLLNPEKLARIPEARFRPMVTVPLGKTRDELKKKQAAKGKKGAQTPTSVNKKGALKTEKKATSKTQNKETNATNIPPPANTPPSSKAWQKAENKAQRGLGHETEIGTGATNKGKKAKKKKKLAAGTIIESEMWDVEDEVGKKVVPREVFPGIIIGAELAKNLRLYVGDDVNVVAPFGGMSPGGPIPKSKPYRVAGIFYSGLYEYDTKYAYVTIPSAQNCLGLEDEITGIEIKSSSLAKATVVARKIKKILGKNGFKVQDWRQRNVNLFSALELEKWVMFIVLTFIVLVASFSIVTNLNMVVLEKLREIAALKAMGSTNGSVLKIFLFAGLYIGIIGMVAGVLAGIGICVLLADVGLPLDPEIYYISELPVRMSPMDISFVAIAGVLLSLLATIYPSIFAARLKPVEALRRHEV